MRRRLQWFIIFFLGLWCASQAVVLKVACAQIVYTSNYEQNITKIIQVINQAADSGADLVLTPEAMMTDYKTGIDVQQAWIDQKLALISQACSTRGIGALVSGNRCEGGNVYIAGYLFDKRGRLLGWYDKAGLLYDETSEGFAKGVGYPVFDFEHNGQVVKLGIQICRDQKYFAGFRILARKGAQVLLHIAAAISNPELPGERRSIHAELRSRAIQNSVYVVSTNKAGNFQLLRSRIYGPRGRILNEVTDAGEYLICADLDLSLADHANLNARRSDLYEIREK